MILSSISKRVTLTHASINIDKIPFFQDPKDSEINVGTIKSEEISLELFSPQPRALFPYSVTLGDECKGFLEYKSYSNFTIDCFEEKFRDARVCKHR